MVALMVAGRRWAGGVGEVVSLAAEGWRFPRYSYSIPLFLSASIRIARAAQVDVMVTHPLRGILGRIGTIR